MVRVAVSESVYRKAGRTFSTWSGGTCLSGPGGEDQLSAFIEASGARHAIVGVDRYDAKLYRALQPGGVLARFGVGYDSIDIHKATANGILCTNTPSTLDQSVAEHAVAMLLAAARRLVDAATSMRVGTWQPKIGIEVHRKRLAVIGCGPIGCRVAGIASRGFGMQVVGCCRKPHADLTLLSKFGFQLMTTSFEEAVREADFVSLHIPASLENTKFINAERISRIAQHAWIINTARGPILDECALYDALAASRIGGAALDVFAVEPYVPAALDKDLRGLPNVLLTPHMGSSTEEACSRMAERALQNIAAAECCRFQEMDLLNPAVLENQALRGNGDLRKR